VNPGRLLHPLALRRPPPGPLAPLAPLPQPAALLIAAKPRSIPSSKLPLNRFCSYQTRYIRHKLQHII